MTLLDDETDDSADALAVGRRIRTLRRAQGMKLSDLAERVGRAQSQLSMIENGKREPRLSMLGAIARALGVPTDELLTPAELDERGELELALEREMRSPRMREVGIEPFRIPKGMPDEALRAMLALAGEIDRLRDERQATPEEARRANLELRRLMRRQGNFFPQLEKTAHELLARIDHTGGPLTQRAASDLAAHLGFTLHYARDLPQSTRSVVDLKNGRVYLSTRSSSDPRAPMLQALASRVLGHSEPRDYAEFLRQRVEQNYLAGALLIPEAGAVESLIDAKKRRAISIEDLRDAYAVSYETAAHRFTNLATRHLDIPVHFLKVHESGTITKAYENDDVNFPTDRIGSIEGQLCCRKWTSRVVFDIEDRFNPYFQYTDTGGGTFWCTARVEYSSQGAHSVSVGVRFDDTRWFVGRDTSNRGVSRHADEVCCRRPPEELSSRWRDGAWPNVATPRTLLATLPTGSFPGVDTTDVYEFLDAHAPR
ncbi:XRE family transcriptional regulator [Microbacterium amylolyticum]|uniref:Transcriptional regulator with XRE-family HTH domain n=1 Tax=Microbacterium amylolyticum TaxID=936337 RepID=A0ABS4ZG77_9MICO|nr:XRE family transcriptional regulator [Microbacterium amylolyticum]MBP2436282.1 transcriptional regulator with XRE-family HTH domain [Microbacterium amylolyticum]